MGIFDLFGKKKFETTNPFSLKAETHPYSLRANTNDYVDLELSLANNSEAAILSSIVLTVPKGLGFERSAIQQQREVRLGFLKPGEQKFVKVPLWATQRTQKGNYPIEIVAISHYNDYAHVLNEARKTIAFRVD